MNNLETQSNNPMSETGSQIGDNTKVEKKKIEVKFKDVQNIDISPEENTLTISKILSFMTGTKNTKEYKEHTS